MGIKLLLSVWLVLTVFASSAYGSMVAMTQTELLVVFNLSKPLPNIVFKNGHLKNLQLYFQKANNLTKGYIVLTSSQAVEKTLIDESLSQIQFNLKEVKKSKTAEIALLQAVEYSAKYNAKNKHILFITDRDILSNSDPILQHVLNQKLYYKLLPKLQSESIQFHIFALNDFSGREQMFLLSQKTNGDFKISQDPTALSMLPITNNKFIVDKNLTEMLLTFESQDKNIGLKRPTGVLIKPGDKSEKLRWKEMGPYHSVVLKTPLEGIWEIKGKVKNPKVSLVSDLKLSFKPLPENIFLGEINTVAASFLKGDKIINDPSFVKKMRVNVSIKNEALMEAQEVVLNDNANGIDDYPEDGIFSSNFVIFDTPGIYDISIQANAIGVKRERHQKIFVHDYPVRIQSEYDIEAKKLLLTAKIKSPLVSQKNFDLSLSIREDNGRIKRFLFVPDGKNNWVTTQNVALIQDVNHYIFQLDGQTQGGRNISVLLPKIDIDDLYFRAEKKYHIMLLKRIRTEDPVLGDMLLFSNERRRENIMVDMMFHYPKFKKYWQRKYTTLQQEMGKLMLGLENPDKPNNEATTDDLVTDGVVEVIVGDEVKSLSELEQTALGKRNQELEQGAEAEQPNLTRKQALQLTKESANIRADWGVLEVIMLFITSLFTMMSVVLIAWIVMVKRKSKKTQKEALAEDPKKSG